MAEAKTSGKINISTQRYLDIAEIKEDTVIMRDGTLRSVLLASSINFALKSEDEQDAVIMSYVSFLNNLNFPIQILLQSRELDIESYIEFLQDKEKHQTNKLLKLQTSEYIEYIKELISIGRIMNKRFYVVIPYNPLSDKHKSFLASVLDIFRPATSIKLKEQKFLRYRDALERRILTIEAGLSGMGVQSVRLDTQGLIELYYRTYNPETSKKQKLADINMMRVEE